MSLCSPLHVSLRCHRRRPSQAFIEAMARNTATGEGGLLAGMDKQIRKPRIGDVAKRAGVSTATVSRTLATPDRVTPKTRDAVMRAVRETGYVLNLAARNLRTSRTHAVLAVLPDASNTLISPG